MVDVNGKMHQVRCKVCNKIEGIEKLLAPKLDSLWKHGSRKEILIGIWRIYKFGEYYMNKNLVHTKNEWLYMVIGKKIKNVN
jgi:hypothetical protein